MEDLNNNEGNNPIRIPKHLGLHVFRAIQGGLSEEALEALKFELVINELPVGLVDGQIMRDTSTDE